MDLALPRYDPLRLRCCGVHMDQCVRWLKRIAHGRLPALARGLADTDDIVSTAIEKALRKIEDFQPKREGAFLAYLWQILRNEIRMQIRSAKARPVMTDELNEGLPSAGPSPLEAAIGRASCRERV